ncbi:nucleoside triphosphate pyrophosphatase [Thermosynechococcaceae cyanobacterium BACA0444]|uniref:Nucleoside triphosphate pyrophosphatase n=1 Tax=Pseudocalidococcus azoricus BACA0444 TaxID=2918990 RepID=A0AAE4FP49_9CYAN|nr:nucleoside triphosphate pyrophosphatase [Pseudocalidococcus azoricus]MDS3859653.1 nucleoside triphosphate pyrophosphatase [Pseudocalidococcus azoricus BACA0444]
MPTLILASASPARRQLLASVGILAQVQVSHVDETAFDHGDPQRLVQVLAQAKAAVIAQRLETPALVLGCDSVLVLEGEVYGKPQDAAEAILRWHQMRGKTGQLFTGHALLDSYQQKSLVNVDCTDVTFAPVSDAEIVAYVESGEPLACAGCFALDGRGGLFVSEIKGNPSNVIGLSLPLLRRMLQELGYQVTDFWQS